jgi:hypothetical protein
LTSSGFLEVEVAWNPEAVAWNPEAVAWNPEAVAWNPEAVAWNPEAVAWNGCNSGSGQMLRQHMKAFAYVV